MEKVFKRYSIVKINFKILKLKFFLFSRFRIDNTDHIIDVNRNGQTGSEYDQVFSFILIHAKNPGIVIFLTIMDWGGIFIFEL